MLAGEAAALYSQKREGGLDVSALAGPWLECRKANHFLLASFSGKDTLAVGASGSGLPALRAALQGDQIHFGGLPFSVEGLQRFAFFTWVGPEVGGMKRGKVALQKGGAAKAFEGTCAELHWSSAEEVTEQAVLAALQRQSAGKACSL
jgi:hypothetical protein